MKRDTKIVLGVGLIACVSSASASVPTHLIAATVGNIAGGPPLLSWNYPTPQTIPFRLDRRFTGFVGLAVDADGNTYASVPVAGLLKYQAHTGTFLGTTIPFSGNTGSAAVTNAGEFLFTTRTSGIWDVGRYSSTGQRLSTLFAAPAGHLIHDVVVDATGNAFISSSPEFTFTQSWINIVNVTSGAALGTIVPAPAGQQGGTFYPALDMAFGPNGSLYYTTGDRLYSVAPEPGALSSLVATGLAGVTIAFGPDNLLYSSTTSAGTLSKLDPITGSIVGTYPLVGLTTGVVDIAFGFAVPSPAAGGLVVAACGVAASRRRRSE